RLGQDAACHAGGSRGRRPLPRRRLARRAGERVRRVPAAARPHDHPRRARGIGPPSRVDAGGGAGPEAAAADPRQLRSRPHRLGDRSRLLSGRARTTVPRQQTLRAAVDWRHELLSKDERTLLRRLADFSGGWTLEAAEAVTAGDGLDALDVLDLLDHLVARN